MKVVGKYMGLAFQANPIGLRLFSPDELESNKLGAVFDNTSRNLQWDEYSFGKGGRVIEILSEHTCQGSFPPATPGTLLIGLPGMIQGYTLTGRTALFPSYEAFIGIGAIFQIR